QGWRLRHPGRRGGLRGPAAGQLFRRHGPAAAPDDAAAGAGRDPGVARCGGGRATAPGRGRMGQGMSEEILINVTPRETRVAVVENGMLQELHIERGWSRGVVGNIYKGKVQRVMPGMQ